MFMRLSFTWSLSKGLFTSLHQTTTARVYPYSAYKHALQTADLYKSEQGLRIDLSESDGTGGVASVSRMQCDYYT